MKDIWTVSKRSWFQQVDPLFKVMSAAFDEGGSSGLMLNNLRCFDDRQDLILDSSSALVQGDCSSDLSQRNSIDMSEIKGMLSAYNNDLPQLSVKIDDYN